MVILATALISASVGAWLTARYERREQFQVLGTICNDIIKRQPEAENTLLSVLKEYKDGDKEAGENNILLLYGYGQEDFPGTGRNYPVLCAAAGVAAGIFLFIISVCCQYRRNLSRIRGLTLYLEQVNAGESGVLYQAKEDMFSGLQDEIYKTITMLNQVKDSALLAKENFAENLSNIAHQLKTPVTAISLSNQLMKEHTDLAYPEQISRQLERLTYLEEALLLLSRIDAGTLVLEKKPVDVFTLLTLAAENLGEILLQKQVAVDIPEMSAVEIIGDMDWTMEAVMNLLKNCLEHTPDSGKIHCTYEKNPLYTQIRIWDEGEGFAKEDLPHLFERFYSGKSGGAGIGLSLAKQIIEMQNGVISAKNLPDGGACFEIRFYCH